MAIPPWVALFFLWARKVSYHKPAKRSPLARDRKVEMADFTATPFVFPGVADQRVLVLGLGGGCDVITAFAVSRLLDFEKARAVIYANTKTSGVGRADAVTEHIRRVPGPQREPSRRKEGHGTTRIDQTVPRGPEGCPWIFLLDHDRAEADLVGEVCSLGFDLVFGVDTGGDSIVARRSKMAGRDQRMLRVLRRTGLPLLHVVVAPGSDGESDAADLDRAFTAALAQGRYRGSFALDPVLPILRSLGEGLNPRRTPQIILAAVEEGLETRGNGRVVVPRGRRPVVPRDWLTRGFVFTPEPLPPETVACGPER
jgi:hypothetical protein